MAEQQHEALQHRDLDQHEARAERAEVDEPRPATGARRSSCERERTDDEQQHQRAGDAHEREQRAQPVAEEHRSAEGDLELIARACVV